MSTFAYVHKTETILENIQRGKTEDIIHSINLILRVCHIFKMLYYIFFLTGEHFKDRHKISHSYLFFKSSECWMVPIGEVALGCTSTYLLDQFWYFLRTFSSLFFLLNCRFSAYCGSSNWNCSGLLFTFNCVYYSTRFYFTLNFFY